MDKKQLKAEVKRLRKLIEKKDSIAPYINLTSANEEKLQEWIKLAQAQLSEIETVQQTQTEPEQQPQQINLTAARSMLELCHQLEQIEWEGLKFWHLGDNGQGEQKFRITDITYTNPKAKGYLWLSGEDPIAVRWKTDLSNPSLPPLPTLKPIEDIQAEVPKYARLGTVADRMRGTVAIGLDSTRIWDDTDLPPETPAWIFHSESDRYWFGKAVWEPLLNRQTHYNYLTYKADLAELIEKYKEALRSEIAQHNQAMYFDDDPDYHPDEGSEYLAEKIKLLVELRKKAGIEIDPDLLKEIESLPLHD